MCRKMLAFIIIIVIIIIDTMIIIIIITITITVVVVIPIVISIVIVIVIVNNIKKINLNNHISLKNMLVPLLARLCHRLGGEALPSLLGAAGVVGPSALSPPTNIHGEMQVLREHA